MKPLPEEGGYYVETYRSAETVAAAALPGRYDRERVFGTAILYLLTAESFSALHRLKSDEVFHFYLGDPVTMLQLHPDGSSEVITLGGDLVGGQKVQVLVPGGTWQGCFVDKGGEFALMGTTVAPGYESGDFESGQREELVGKYPGRGELIVRLTRGPVSFEP
jgi:predicted cupin superfamily sugar epimerase